MSVREKNKEQNRQRVLKAAKSIIEKQGIEQLTMRHLAEQAQVSLRTPYNLFGSKTDVLIALIDEPMKDFQSAIKDIQATLIIDIFFKVADKALLYYSTKEEYYRGIYWGIMSSEHKESRDQAIERIEQTTLPIVTAAVANRELDANLDIHGFNKNLVLVMVALAGMWGSGQLSAQAVLNHTKYSWCTNFLCYSNRKSKPVLKQYLSDIQQSLYVSTPLHIFTSKS